MARVRVSDEVAIEIRTTVRVRDDLARLVATGFYGDSVASAAEEMMRERLRQVLDQEKRLECIKRARERKKAR